MTFDETWQKKLSNNFISGGEGQRVAGDVASERAIAVW